MNFIQPKTKKFFVNLFAEYILSKISTSENSIINVIDVENFIIIKGKTTSNEIIDVLEILNNLKSEFPTYVPDDVNMKTIDLIEYGCELQDHNDVEIELFKSRNSLFSESELQSTSEQNINKKDHDLIHVSSFPFGYSYSQGRLSYYICKKISYEFFQIKNCDKLEVKCIDKKIFVDGYEVLVNYEELHTKIKNELESENFDRMYEITNLEKELNFILD